MATRPSRQFHLADLIAAVLFCGLGAALFTGGRQGTADSGTILHAMAVVAVVWLVLRKFRGGSRCDECGRRFVPTRTADPEAIDGPPKPDRNLCPNCVNLRADRTEAEKQQTGSLRQSLFILIAIGLGFGVFAAATLRQMYQSGDWHGLPFLLLSNLLPLAFVFWLSRRVIRSRRIGKLITEEGMLQTARRCAGEEGTLVDDGPIRIWYTGAEDPTPMIREEIAASHRRFDSLLGETGIEDPPLRILGFHDREALRSFYRENFPGMDLSTHLGLYFKRPFRILFLVTTETMGRMDNPRMSFGSLHDLVMAEQAYATFPAPWVEMGIMRALIARARPGTLGRLNRRMIVAIEDGSAWSEDMFTASSRKVGKMLLRPDDPAIARKVGQFTEQSWSIVEYLGGESTPDDRRAAFRAFLKASRSRSHPADSFFRHFGYGYASMLEAWREWVLEQGASPEEPPPPSIRDGLTRRVLPAIRDRSTPRGDRIQAIRDWRQAGYTMGADSLIELLREPGEIPKEEIVWALRMVSGMGWGDEPDRWQGWWDGLPVEWPASEVIAEGLGK